MKLSNRAPRDHVLPIPKHRSDSYEAHIDVYVWRYLSADKRFGLRPNQACGIRSIEDETRGLPGEIWRCHYQGIFSDGFREWSICGGAEVQSMELRDASSPLRITGAVVTIREGGRLERESRSFIDYDEIDSLIKGLDYVARADSTVTKLSAFEANYSTKGDLMISVYSQQTGELGAAISSGSIGTVRVFFTLDDLSKFRSLLVEAKAKLDGIR